MCWLLRSSYQRSHACVWCICISAMFVVRRTNSTFGDRSFAVAGARIWNSLPSSLRSADLSTEWFKRALKTFLFVWDRGATVTFLLKARRIYIFGHTYIHTLWCNRTLVTTDNNDLIKSGCITIDGGAWAGETAAPSLFRAIELPIFVVSLFFRPIIYTLLTVSLRCRNFAYKNASVKRTLKKRTACMVYFLSVRRCSHHIITRLTGWRDGEKTVEGKKREGKLTDSALPIFRCFLRMHHRIVDRHQPSSRVACGWLIQAENKTIPRCPNTARKSPCRAKPTIVQTSKSVWSGIGPSLFNPWGYLGFHKERGGASRDAEGVERVSVGLWGPQWVESGES